jgi:hypothetical protein
MAGQENSNVLWFTHPVEIRRRSFIEEDGVG